MKHVFRLEGEIKEARAFKATLFLDIYRAYSTQIYIHVCLNIF
jgi:hypothetical protein